MKMERLFEAKNSKLFKIQSNEEFFPLEREIKWSEVEPAENEFNENFLANLRDELKKSEEKNEFFVIVPKIDREIKSKNDEAQFISAMKHAARRIKDCASVVGFSIPKNIAESEFLEEISQKHKHYCFLSESGWIQALD